MLSFRPKMYERDTRKEAQEILGQFDLPHSKASGLRTEAQDLGHSTLNCTSQYKDLDAVDCNQEACTLPIEDVECVFLWTFTNVK